MGRATELTSLSIAMAQVSRALRMGRRSTGSAGQAAVTLAASRPQISPVQALAQLLRADSPVFDRDQPPPAYDEVRFLLFVFLLTFR